MIVFGIILIPLSIAICVFVIALAAGRIRERARTRRHTGRDAAAIEATGTRPAGPPTQPGYESVDAARAAVRAELDGQEIINESRGVIYAQRSDGRWDAIEEVE